MSYNFRYTVLFSLLLLLNVSCNDFLEIAPETQVNTAQFYQVPKDFETALVGAYSTLTQGYYGSDFFAFGEIRSDNTETGGYARVFEVFGTFELDATSPIVAAFWAKSYQGIQTANAIVGKIEAAEVPDAQRKQIVGEAKFIRALFYFNLVQIFGPVPLVTNVVTGGTISEIYSIGRTPEEEVYQQIISDLQDAETALAGGPIPNEGRATIGSAKALLGKVYLTRQDYAAANTKLQEVIDLGNYVLLSDYQALFPPAVQENNSESIFEIQHLGGPEGAFGSLANLFAPRGSGDDIVLFTEGEGGRMVPTEDLINSYPDNDLRKDASVGFWIDPNEIEFPYPKKYLTTPFANDNDGANVYVLRYADVLLMKAEALNQIGYEAGGEAFDLLNQVRSRAGLADLTSAELPDQVSFQDHVLQERRWELAFEFHRWFDLKRTNTAISVINEYKPALSIEPNDLLFPLPAAQIANNPDVLIQNPGY